MSELDFFQEELNNPDINYFIFDTKGGTKNGSRPEDRVIKSLRARAFLYRIKLMKRKNEQISKR